MENKRRNANKMIINNIWISHLQYAIWMDLVALRLVAHHHPHKRLDTDIVASSNGPENWPLWKNHKGTFSWLQQFGFEYNSIITFNVVRRGFLLAHCPVGSHITFSDGFRSKRARSPTKCAASAVELRQSHTHKYHIWGCFVQSGTLFPRVCLGVCVCVCMRCW